MKKLEQGHYYHIFNRGINSDIIFKDENNMHYFLKLIEKHLTSKVTVLAYCLMNNHFHLAVEIIVEEKIASQALSNLFNAYNKENSRTGTLFERPFKRTHIENEEYLRNIILYIHKNPENHNVIKNFREYDFSSYCQFISEKENLILHDKEYIINLFDGLNNFIFCHTKNEKIKIRPVRFSKPDRSYQYERPIL